METITGPQTAAGDVSAPVVSSANRPSDSFLLHCLHLDRLVWADVCRRLCGFLLLHLSIHTCTHRLTGSRVS